VYGWIWRRLPFGLPGKLAGSVVLIVAAVALLWYVVFPAIDPYLPFNNGGVTSQDGTVPNAPAGQSTTTLPASPSPTR
jgi:hypothetical protein